MNRAAGGDTWIALFDGLDAAVTANRISSGFISTIHIALPTASRSARSKDRLYDGELLRRYNGPLLTGSKKSLADRR